LFDKKFEASASGTGAHKPPKQDRRTPGVSRLSRRQNLPPHLCDPGNPGRHRSRRSRSETAYAP